MCVHDDEEKWGRPSRPALTCVRPVFKALSFLIFLRFFIVVVLLYFSPLCSPHRGARLEVNTRKVVITHRPADLISRKKKTTAAAASRVRPSQSSFFRGVRGFFVRLFFSVLRLIPEIYCVLARPQYFILIFIINRAATSRGARTSRKPNPAGCSSL